MSAVGRLIQARPRHVFYLVCHFFLVALGVFAAQTDRPLLQAIGASLVAAGIAGGVVFFYVLQADRVANQLQILRDFGLTRAFQARSVRIRPEYDHYLSKVTKEIALIGFGLRSLREDHLENFAQWSQRANVRILLLDPDFPTEEWTIAAQRDREENNTQGAIKRDVMKFVGDTATALRDVQSARFHIKLYRCLPTLNVFRIDGVLFWGPYLVGGQSRNMPTFLVEERGILFKRLLGHFDAIWDSEELSRDVPKAWQNETT